MPSHLTPVLVSLNEKGGGTYHVTTTACSEPPRTVRVHEQASSAFGALSCVSEPTHDLSRTPELAKKVLRRLESASLSPKRTLRADQQSMAMELLENGRSVEEVARAFDVAVATVRTLTL